MSEWGVGAMAANPDEKVPEAEEETARLAILDLDWSKVPPPRTPIDSFLWRHSAAARIENITIQTHIW